MYKMILVPLDGSELAEMVLPHVETLVRACEGPVEVVLLEVCEPPRVVMAGYVGEAAGQAAIVAEQAAQACRKEAEQYLEATQKKLNKKLKKKGVKVRAELLIGSPGEEILDYAANHPVDLIAMASHGRSGISRWAYGSVASKVLRGIATPTLVVTPEKK